MKKTKMKDERKQKVVVDIMVGERYYITFRQMMDTKPVMMPDGECKRCVDGEDLMKEIIGKFPSLQKKKFRVCV